MTWSLATEDELSEAVGIRILQERGAFPYQCLRRGGFGYLYKMRENWKALAKRHYVLVLTDLDQKECPVSLKENWFGQDPLPPSLCFRIAVREVEAWLLADHDAMANLFGKKLKQLNDPEAHRDPKSYLLQQAQRSSRAIKDDLVREENGKLKQGLGYNARLCDLVRTHWDPHRAALRAPSLAKALDRIADLAAHP